MVVQDLQAIIVHQVLRSRIMTLLTLTLQEHDHHHQDHQHHQLDLQDDHLTFHFLIHHQHHLDTFHQILFIHPIILHLPELRHLFHLQLIHSKGYNTAVIDIFYHPDHLLVNTTHHLLLDIVHVLVLPRDFHHLIHFQLPHRHRKVSPLKVSIHELDMT